MRTEGGLWTGATERVHVVPLILMSLVLTLGETFGRNPSGPGGLDFGGDQSVTRR